MTTEYLKATARTVAGLMQQAGSLAGKALTRNPSYRGLTSAPRQAVPSFSRCWPYCR